ncbi:MAG: helicase C-terminal domain-containing protein [Chloroflexota bacterium]
MRGELVAIDLETTGLDVNTDRIIEIGAVRMKEGEVLDEFSELVNPNMHIPERTTTLTGIRSADVADAPLLPDVLPRLLQFVGELPIVGHSVGFDMSFLNKQGVFTTNTVLDTYDLASVMVPRAPRYNLNSLAVNMGINLEDAHRAFDDALASGVLYWMLYEKTLKLPPGTLRAIVDAAQGIDWYARPTFEAALAEVLENTGADTAGTDERAERPSKIAHLRPLYPNDEVTPLEVDAIGDVFGRDGELAQEMHSFEYRPQQEDMARRIAEAFNNGEHLMVEAGTGTGKSMAYLVPAFEWATANNARVVISTDTIALQDQLIAKDIPALQESLGIHVNAAVLKGRANYLCPLAVEAMKRRGPTNIEELRVLAKILVWQLESDSGDKTEISLRGGAEHSIWNRLSSAENHGCRGNACRDELGFDCPFHQAYKRAEAAHLLIVNHSLLVADAKAENRVVPEYQHIIVDEAHHLEDAVTSSMRFVIDESAMIRRLDDLGDSRRGLLADLITALRKSDVPEKTTKRIEAFATDVNAAANDMRVHVTGLFKAVKNLARSLTSLKQGDYTVTVRIDEQAREKSSFQKLQQRWEILAQFMEVISEATDELSNVLGKLSDYNIDNYNDMLRSTQTVARYLEDTRTTLHTLVKAPDANTIYWISVTPDMKRIALNTAPLHVGPVVTENLWNSKRSVILTSATLRTSGTFDHIRERIHADMVSTYEVGSPFDYRESTMVFLPTDVPEPREYQTYQQMVEQAILELAVALDGRVMVLFTSFGQLRQTSRIITPVLANRNITVYDQSDGTSRQNLLEGFKTTDRAVLLGTRSFWEGVDVPGESLSALVMTRLPFPVPNDPVFAARSETYDNHFNQYAVPEAILRFRQGFGRLIRTKTDRGIVVILDSRITTRGYGAAFIDSLPDCTIESAPLGELARRAKAWLD